MPNSKDLSSLLTRILDLVDVMYDHQFKEGDELPLPGTAVGTYKSITSFVASLRKQVPNDTDDVKLLTQFETIGDVEVTSGSSMMAMWFMSQTHAILSELKPKASDDEVLQAQWDAVFIQVEEALEALREQLHTARQVPYFYQGNGQAYDKFNIPVGVVPSNAMGWWPLVHYPFIHENDPPADPCKKAGLAIPPWHIRPEQVQQSPFFQTLYGMLQSEEFGIQATALSDIDFWAWTMAVEDTTPDILEFPDRKDPSSSGMDTREHFSPLLPSDVEKQFTKNEKYFTPSSRELIKGVRSKNPDVWPLALYYGVDASINQLPPPAEPPPEGQLPDIVMHKQTVDSSIVCNVLSSVVLMYDKLKAHTCPKTGESQPDLRPEFRSAAGFVRTGLKMALYGELPWNIFSYSYYPIHMSPLSYITRAQKRIVEVNRRRKANGQDGVEDLYIFDDNLTREVGLYAVTQAQKYLNEPHLYSSQGAVTYANLVYTFNTLANLRYMEPGLFATHGSEYEQVYTLLVESLLLHNKDAETVIGTGPYFLLPDLPLEVLGDFLETNKYPFPHGNLSGFQLSIEFPMASPCFVWPPLMEAFALHILHEWDKV